MYLFPSSRLVDSQLISTLKYIQTLLYCSAASEVNPWNATLDTDKHRVIQLSILHSITSLIYLNQKPSYFISQVVSYVTYTYLVPITIHGWIQAPRNNVLNLRHNHDKTGTWHFISPQYSSQIPTYKCRYCCLYFTYVIYSGWFKSCRALLLNLYRPGFQSK